MQYVQFIIGQAVLTPPVRHDGDFLAGERITLAGQDFVVTRDDQSTTSRQLRTSDGTRQAQVRRVAVVQASLWDGPLIDREFTWPDSPDGSPPPSENFLLVNPADLKHGAPTGPKQPRKPKTEKKKRRHRDGGPENRV